MGQQNPKVYEAECTNVVLRQVWRCADSHSAALLSSRGWQSAFRSRSWKELLQSPEVAANRGQLARASVRAVFILWQAAISMSHASSSLATDQPIISAACLIASSHGICPTSLMASSALSLHALVSSCAKCARQMPAASTHPG